MQNLIHGERSGNSAPHETTNRVHCQRLKELLHRRNLQFEEKVSGNTTIISIRSNQSSENTQGSSAR